jgi:peptidoglycan-N-acetylglucosamine deacetylase
MMAPGPAPPIACSTRYGTNASRRRSSFSDANAASFPKLVRREAAEGHTVAHHSFSHPLLARLPFGAAEADIDRGIAAVETAVSGGTGLYPATPFFRFPGFASSPALLGRLKQRGIVVFGADLWASDWNPMTPADELALVMGRLNANGGGILLFHDTKAQTAAMLPAFLRELKRHGYRVVHVVPGAAIY